MERDDPKLELVAAATAVVAAPVATAAAFVAAPEAAAASGADPCRVLS
jgi:hypothetical protein